MTLEARNNVNTTAMEMLPACVKSCGSAILPKYNCQQSEPCYCESKTPWGQEMSVCLKANCTLDEQLQAQGFQADTCGLGHASKETEYQAIVYTLFALAVIFTLARLLSRFRTLRGPGFWWDDYAVLASAVPLIAIQVDSDFSLRYGLGRDLWTLTGNQLVSFLKWFYIAEPLYIAITRLTKLSLVLLYMRLWPQRHTFFYSTCIVVAVFLSCSLLASLFASIFQCSPVGYYWRHVITGTRGSCVDQKSLSIANASVVIFSDVVVLLLPLPKLLKFKVSPLRKIGICSVFLVGFAVTACSCVRITYILLYPKSTNITYEYYGLALWSHIEVYLSTVCCNMPQMPPLIRRCWRVSRKGTPIIDTSTSPEMTASRSNLTSSATRGTTEEWMPGDAGREQSQLNTKTLNMLASANHATLAEGTLGHKHGRNLA